MDAITILKREILLTVDEETLEEFIAKFQSKEFTTKFKLERVNQSFGADDSDYINKLWDELSEFFVQYPEYIYEFRDSFDENTGLQPRITTYVYDSKEVAKPITGGNGKWIGWLYWYGGGRHDRPEVEPWIETAQVLEMKEEMRVVLVFKRE